MIEVDFLDVPREEQILPDFFSSVKVKEASGVLQDLLGPKWKQSPTILPVIFPLAAEEMINYNNTRDDDVWVLSQPKCGTTWVQEMVWLIAHDLDFETAKKKDLFQERSMQFE